MQALGVVAGDDEERGCRLGADSEVRDELRSGPLNKRLEGCVELGDLGLERLAASGERSEGELAGSERMREGTRAERGADLHESLNRSTRLGKGLSQLRRRCHDQCFHRVDRLGARFHGTLSSDAQHPNHLDVAVTGLRDRRSIARKDRGGCRVRVGRIGLAVPAAALTVGPDYFEHRHVVDEEEASKSCAIAAGALNLEGPEFPGALRPGEEFPIAGSGRRYVLLREGPPELVFCLCDVDVFVGVDPTVTRGPTCAIVDLAIVLLSSWSMAGRADSTATGLLPASYQVTARSVGRADGDGRDLGRQIKAKARSR